MFNSSKTYIQNHNSNIQTYLFFKSNHHIKFMIYMKEIHKSLIKSFTPKTHYSQAYHYAKLRIKYNILKSNSFSINFPINSYLEDQKHPNFKLEKQTSCKSIFIYMKSKKGKLSTHRFILIEVGLKASLFDFFKILFLVPKMEYRFSHIP